MKLLQASTKESNGKNVLVSPLSVQITLAMLANGAKGTTKTEIESVFGGISTSDMNRYLYNYWMGLPMANAYKVNIANSLWVNSRAGVTVPKSFLQTLADHFDVQAYKSDFGKQTITDMNNWIKQRTNGLVDNITDSLDPKTDALVLLNTLLFEAEWEKTYGAHHISTGTFTTESGEQRSVRMMTNTETMRYINDGDAVGFAKDYKDGYYSFVALLPNVGTSLEEYIASLTAEKIQNALNSDAFKVYSEIPKFSYSSDLDMNKVLSDMGMPTAFSTGADFTGLDASGGTYVDEVRHKTYIEMSEEGTKAGAVTSAKMMKGTRDASVRLNRPFVYMIVDNTSNLPIFIGTVTDVGN